MPDKHKHRQRPGLLLIDDDIIAREILMATLEPSGYAVDAVSDGEAALEWIAEDRGMPEMILLDAQLPGVSGMQLIDELRTQTGATIYLISGSGPPADLIAAADGFLEKPFTLEALENLLKKKMPRREAASKKESGQPAVSSQTLAELRAMMPETAVREIFSTLVADLDRRLNALESAVSTRDWAEARRIGHTIKGGCALAGAVEAAHLGELIENGALEAEFDHENYKKVTEGDNYFDNNASTLSNLRAAARRLERMLSADLTV
jgi:DNA-binding response OmpR family regulator